jgi:phosphoglycolate phosphatase-like HAD superfamily hydrolase
LPVEHIVWDWNGTLLADGQALIESTIDAFDAVGLEAITFQDYQKLHCQPIPVFYDRLAGRKLSALEQASLDEAFQVAYQRRRDGIGLTQDTVGALTAWRETNGTQSLLSMHPHDRLMSLVRKFELLDFFARVDGLTGNEFAGKSPYLRRHLTRLGVSGETVLLVGDSVDDARAALECGIACVLYHAGPTALHVLEHFTEVGVPVVNGLRDAVAAVLDGSLQFAVVSDR